MWFWVLEKGGRGGWPERSGPLMSNSNVNGPTGFGARDPGSLTIQSCDPELIEAR